MPVPAVQYKSGRLSRTSHSVPSPPEEHHGAAGEREPHPDPPSPRHSSLPSSPLDGAPLWREETQQCSTGLPGSSHPTLILSMAYLLDWVGTRMASLLVTTMSSTMASLTMPSTMAYPKVATIASTKASPMVATMASTTASSMVVHPGWSSGWSLVQRGWTSPWSPSW